MKHLTSWLLPTTSGWRGTHLMAAHRTVQRWFEPEGRVPRRLLAAGTRLRQRATLGRWLPRQGTIAQVDGYLW